MSKEYQYPGEELKLFEEAKNWKKYLASEILPYTRGNVLEVGAGISETTPFLINTKVTSWTCLEPDNEQLNVVQEKINNGILPTYCKAKAGTLRSIPLDQKYDTIIYIDVLEHIEDDKGEIKRISGHLQPGGHLVILSPAYQLFYNPFDKAVGHYRRYTKKSLRQIVDGNGLTEQKMLYIESAGMALLLLNKFIFRRKYPSAFTIKVWDKLFIPLSRLIDKLTFHSIGKTVIGIWKNA